MSRKRTKARRRRYRRAAIDAKRGRIGCTLGNTNHVKLAKVKSRNPVADGHSHDIRRAENYLGEGFGLPYILDYVVEAGSATAKAVWIQIASVIESHAGVFVPIVTTQGHMRKTFHTPRLVMQNQTAPTGAPKPPKGGMPACPVVRDRYLSKYDEVRKYWSAITPRTQAPVTTGRV